MLKDLVIVRHGDYDYGAGDPLNARGREQAQTLAEQLKSVIDGASTYILSSTALRAIQSAIPLAEQLGVGFVETDRRLWMNGEFLSDKEREDVDEFIGKRRESYENIILVGHLLLARYYPTHFFAKELGTNPGLMGLVKGQAIRINLEDGGKFEYFPKG